MTTESQKAATRRYKQKNIRRIALEMQNAEYILVKGHADSSGETVSGYIKAAMRDRMRREDAGDV